MKNLLTVLLAFFSVMSYAQKSEINTLLDNWHIAAAEANFEAYFGPIHEGGRFLGTDASERWTKDQFIEFSKPYFDKGKAWSFTPKDRLVFLADEGNYAWFDEVLDTWMGPCRGSGILMKTDQGWKIMQYNLAILVANDDVKDYLKILEGKKEG